MPKGQTYHLSKGTHQAILALLAPDISLADEVDAVIHEFASTSGRSRRFSFSSLPMPATWISLWSEPGGFSGVSHLAGCWNVPEF
jgi:hypothetical protein